MTSIQLLARVSAMGTHGLPYCPESEEELELLAGLVEAGSVVRTGPAEYRLPELPARAFPPTEGGDLAYMNLLHARGHGNVGQFDPTALEPKTRKPYAVINVWFDGTAFEAPASERLATLDEALERREQLRSIARFNVIARCDIYDVRTGEVVA